MEYKNLPGTSLKLSQLCLGTMMFGGQTSEADSLQIMDYAYDQGINFFDTANTYVQGESEFIVGKGLKGRRHDIFLATKVRGQMGSGRNDFGLNRRNILAALESSLQRLDTDYLDLYYLHAPDYDTSLEETVETMSSLVRSGKIRYWGVSNFAAWQVADMLAICDKRNYIPPCATQNVYNALTRGIEAEFLPFLKAHPLGLVIYNPIAGGLLSGKHAFGQPSTNTRFANNQEYYKRYWSQENFTAVEKLQAIAEAQNLSLLQLAMKWCAAQPQVTSTITGVSRLEQLKQNINSIEGEPLSKEVLAQCDEIWLSLAGTRFAYNR
jgi:aryl-alcohol dehydrogenase-like predicted oxidoreductase